MRNAFHSLLMGFGLSLVLATFGCGENKNKEDDLASVEDEGCEHMEQGPDVDITAGADIDGAPDASAEHTRLDITLVDNEGYGGFVSVDSEGGDYVFFLNRDVPFIVLDDQNEEIAIEASELPFEGCSAIAVSHAVELPLGLVVLGFGPATEPSVSMVVEHGEHE